jgi:hypothetical protein
MIPDYIFESVVGIEPGAIEFERFLCDERSAYQRANMTAIRFEKVAE